MTCEFKEICDGENDALFCEGLVYAKPWCFKIKTKIQKPDAVLSSPTDLLCCDTCKWQPGAGGIDGCMQPIVEALNKAGLETIASCCGHGKRPGNIALRDGREIMILPDYETGREIGKFFPPIS